MEELGSWGNYLKVKELSLNIESHPALGDAWDNLDDDTGSASEWVPLLACIPYISFRSYWDQGFEAPLLATVQEFTVFAPEPRVSGASLLKLTKTMHYLEAIEMHLNEHEKRDMK